MNCTRCEGTGFLNTHQLPQDEEFWNAADVVARIQRAIYGFGVGDWAFYDNPKRKKTKRIKTLGEAKRSAKRFAKSVS